MPQLLKKRNIKFRYALTVAATVPHKSKKSKQLLEKSEKGRDFWIFGVALEEEENREEEQTNCQQSTFSTCILRFDILSDCLLDEE